MTQRDFAWIGTFAREFHPSKSWISVASSRNGKKSAPRLESARLVVQDFDRLTPEQNALMSGFVALITAAACNLHTARALKNYTPVEPLLPKII